MWKELKWFGEKGIIPLGQFGQLAPHDQRIAEIVLTEEPRHGMATSGHYVGLKVNIINKQTGKIASALFLFDDYMAPCNVPGSMNYVASYDQEWCWYSMRHLPQPNSSPVIDAIADYLRTMK